MNFEYDFEAMERVRNKYVEVRVALLSNRPEVVRQLLSAAGADLQAVMQRQTDQGLMLLHEAVEAGSFPLVEAIVEGSGMVDVRANIGTPAWLASTKEDGLEILSYLARKGADLNVRDLGTGYSMLMNAIWKERYDNALFLIEQGVDFGESVTSTRGWSAVDFAATSTDERVFFKLVELGALDVRGETPLQLAVSRHARTMVDACIAHPEYRRPLFETDCEALLNACVFDDMRSVLLAARSSLSVGDALVGEPVNPTGDGWEEVQCAPRSRRGMTL